MKYLWFTFAAMLAWGLWAFLPRLAADKVPSTSAIGWEWLGSLVVAVPLFLYLGLQTNPANRMQTGPGWWFLFAVAAGTCGFGGALLYYIALRLSPQNTATVIVLSALYPVVGVLLTVIVLRQRLNLGQVAGIVLSIAGAVLLVWASERTRS